LVTTHSGGISRAAPSWRDRGKPETIGFPLAALTTLRGKKGDGACGLTEYVHTFEAGVAVQRRGRKAEGQSFVGGPSIANIPSPAKVKSKKRESRVKSPVLKGASSKKRKPRGQGVGGFSRIKGSLRAGGRGSGGGSLWPKVTWKKGVSSHAHDRSRAQAHVTEGKATKTVEITRGGKNSDGVMLKRKFNPQVVPCGSVYMRVRWP